MTKKLLVLTAFLALAGGQASYAGSLGGVINVSMTVVAKCSTRSGADARTGGVETSCTAGESAQVQRSVEQPRDGAYTTSREGADAHEVVTVSF